MKQLLLSFDVEEFDLPLEFGTQIDDELMFKMGLDGFREVLELVRDLKVTFFVSARFAEKYPDIIESIGEQHEIALHCLRHDDDYSKMSEIEFKDNISKAKKILEKITGRKVVGFRSPRMQKPRYDILEELGFLYDSSYNPTWIPGRYNNFFGTRKIFVKNHVVVVPITTLPILRIPLFWLSFRNFGFKIGNFISKYCFQDFINFYLHPWEFVDLSNFDLPFYIKRNTGEKLIDNLKRFLDSNKFERVTFSNYIKEVYLKGKKY